MRLRSLTPALLLLLLVAPSGLRAQANDIVKLLPADVVGLVHIASLETVKKRMVEAAGYFGEAKEAESAFKEMVSDMAPFSDQLDHSKPLVIALLGSEEAMGMPGIAMVLPVTDVAAVTQSHGGLHVSGSYVMRGEGGDSLEPATEPATILTGLPQGDVVLRVNLEPLAEQYLPLVEMFLPMMVSEMESQDMEGVDPEELGDMMLDGITAFAESAGMMDIALTMKGGFLAASGSIGMRAGTPLGKSSQQVVDRITPMARLMPKDCFISMGQDMDMGEINELYKGFWDEMRSEVTSNMPPDFKEELIEAMDLLMEFQSLGASRTAFGAKFTSRGLVASGALQHPKPTKLLDLMTRLSKLSLMDKMGIDSSMKAVEKVGETQVHEMRMAATDKLFEMLEATEEESKVAKEAISRLIGPEGLKMQFAALPKHLAFAMNPAAGAMKGLLAAAVNEQAPVPAAFAKLLRRAGAEPKFVVSVDMGRMIREIGPTIADLAPEPDLPEFEKLPSARFDLWAGVSPGSWRFGLGADLKGIGKMAQVMDR